MHSPRCRVCTLVIPPVEATAIELEVKLDGRSRFLPLHRECWEALGFAITNRRHQPLPYKA